MIVIVTWPAFSTPVMVYYIQCMEEISEALERAVSELLQYSCISVTSICQFCYYSDVPSCHSQIVPNLGHIHMVMSLGSYPGAL